MAFIKDDAGRSKSKRPKQRNDCVVRALSIAYDLPYDDAYDMLAKAGRKSGRGTSKRIWQPIYSDIAVKMSFPAIKGQKRMDVSEFCMKFPTGRYVLQCAGHLIAVINGIVYDDFSPRFNACVYACWEF